MAGNVDTGMEKDVMKRLLKRSKQEPVNCAIGQGPDPGFGLLLLAKGKGAKKLQQELEKQIPEAKNTRFGTAYVDVDSNPKLVQFNINKPISSMAKKLVKTLKGTGFTKVQILVEGASVEEATDEED